MSHGVYTNRLVLRNETDPVVLRCVESSNTLRGQKNRKVFNPLKRSGYYVYRAGVTMCTAQWLLCVPHSGYYVYRAVVTMCTAQWLLCVPHSGYYVYRAGVTMCTAQWLLCVPHSGYYVYRTVVTMCTTSCNTHKFCVLFVCSVWISEQTASIARHSTN